MPGPHEQVPWAPQDQLNGSNGDAIADGRIAMLGQGLRLLTPLGRR